MLGQKTQSFMDVNRKSNDVAIMMPNIPPKIHKRTASIMNCIIIDF